MRRGVRANGLYQTVNCFLLTFFISPAISTQPIIIACAARGRDGVTVPSVQYCHLHRCAASIQRTMVKFYPNQSTYDAAVQMMVLIDRFGFAEKL